MVLCVLNSVCVSPQHIRANVVEHYIRSVFTSPTEIENIMFKNKGVPRFSDNPRALAEEADRLRLYVPTAEEASQVDRVLLDCGDGTFINTWERTQYGEQEQGISKDLYGTEDFVETEINEQLDETKKLNLIGDLNGKPEKSDSTVD